MRTQRGAERDGVVYSSDSGRRCRACGAPVAVCRCRDAVVPTSGPGDGVVRVGRETKGRKGAGVTIVTGVAGLNAAELSALCTRLKKRCGSGGTVRDGKIEIQGDHREVVAAELRTAGWKQVKVWGA